MEGRGRGEERAILGNGIRKAASQVYGWEEHNRGKVRQAAIMKDAGSREDQRNGAR